MEELVDAKAERDAICRKFRREILMRQALIVWRQRLGEQMILEQKEDEANQSAISICFMAWKSIVRGRKR